LTTAANGIDVNKGHKKMLSYDGWWVLTLKQSQVTSITCLTLTQTWWIQHTIITWISGVISHSYFRSAKHNPNILLQSLWMQLW
jgi:hypothetical protein